MDGRRRYYSERAGREPTADPLDLEFLRDAFLDLAVWLEDEGYLQKCLGYRCVDAGFVPGDHGYDLEKALRLELGRSGLTPLRQRIPEYSEEDLFDVLEFLHANCVKPTSGHHHAWGNCGWHSTAFEHGDIGKAELRNRVNLLLRRYGDGFELSERGEVLALAPTGLQPLLEAVVPAHDPSNVQERIQAACLRFRRHNASLEDRRGAVRDLAEVLEFLRPQVKNVLTKKDESDLFMIANNFAIRHHRADQQSEYDKPIWYSWMFYFYLATLHAALRLIDKANGVASM